MARINSYVLRGTVVGALGGLLFGFDTAVNTARDALDKLHAALKGWDDVLPRKNTGLGENDPDGFVRGSDVKSLTVIAPGTDDQTGVSDGRSGGKGNVFVLDIEIVDGAKCIVTARVGSELLE